VHSKCQSVSSVCHAAPASAVTYGLGKLAALCGMVCVSSIMWMIMFVLLIQITKDEFFASIARDIMSYVGRDLSDKVSNMFLIVFNRVICKNC